MRKTTYFSYCNYTLLVYLMDDLLVVLTPASIVTVFIPFEIQKACLNPFLATLEMSKSTISPPTLLKNIDESITKVSRCPLKSVNSTT